MAHTYGVESVWSMMKLEIVGTYHKLISRHLCRYADEFAGRHNVLERDKLAQIACLAASVVGKRLTYRALIADNVGPVLLCPLSR